MRLIVWGALFGILYVVRSFFLLVLLTFVFAYIQSSAVNWLENSIKHRVLRVVMVAISMLAIIVGVGMFLVPHVKHQAVIFAEHLPNHIATIDKEISEARKSYPWLEKILPASEEDTSITIDGTTKHTTRSVASSALQEMLGLGNGDEAKAGLKGVVDALRNIGAPVLASASAFLLSLLFSFLIVLDLPKLSASVRALKDTKIGFIYDEVAPSIYEFASVMGSALEAQLYIAIVNTILTALGTLLLGFGPEIPFISMIVFICSFIPVAGVFMSSVPICLVALQLSGLGLMFFAAILITVIHMIETYILNPRIYGHQLHLNPVIVLIILTVGGKLFGVWGLVLGVPICTYIFGYAIRFKGQTVSD